MLFLHELKNTDPDHLVFLINQLYKVLMKKIILFISFFIVTSTSWSRPEYAVSHQYVNCTQCHQSPLGGGMRNSNGKDYGSHSYWPGQQSKKEWFQIDVRSELVYTKGPTAERKGLVMMTTTPSFAIPITEVSSDILYKSTYILSYGLGLLDQGLRDSYIKLQSQQALGHTVLIGRFVPAFGLATDEHRTYTRLQSRSGIIDYEAGLGFSADPIHILHYDLAFTSGLQSGGASLSTNDSPYAYFANIRLNPMASTSFFGVSHSSHSTMKLIKPLTATSLYSSVSLTPLILKMTNKLLPINLLFEFVQSAGWNNTDYNPMMTSYFFPSSAATWYDSLKQSEALGTLFQINYDLTPKWILTYKAETFTPDTQFKGDYFEKHGFGVKHFVNSQMSFNVRVERAFSTRPGITESTNARAASNMGFILFHLWL